MRRNSRLQIDELKRRLSINKHKFMKSLDEVFDTLRISSNRQLYMDEYEELCDKMIAFGSQYIELESKMNKIDNEFEHLKLSLIDREKIDLYDVLSEHNERGKGVIIDLLHRVGFIDAEKWSELKEHIWNNRYRHNYGD